MSSQGVLTSRIDRLRLLPGISLLIAFAAQAQIGFEPVRSFGFPDGMGDSASGGVIEGSDHNLYGTTVEGGRDGNYGVVYRVQRDGTGYLALHHFSGAPTDGAQSVAALTEGPGGVLYGTTTRGGSNDAGTVFKLNLNGSGYVVLHHFGGGNDGANLQAGILVGSDGMLYGATRAGGLLGSGTLFKLNTDGSGYSAFYSFSGPDDGVDARGTLIEVSNRLYGTTSLGGGSAHGTVFGVNKDGSGFLLLRSFAGAPTDGFDSWAGLLSGTDGALYGTTRQGGSASQGIIFKVNPNGSGYEVLHHFGGAGDGQQPWARVLEETDGKLYGTARNGGTHINGTLFRLNKDGGGYETLHHFDGGIGEGYRPEGMLIRASDGRLYGTTRLGGRANIGSIYTIQPDGSAFATTHSFSVSGGDGRESYSRLLAASDGYLYGTALNGGAFEGGIIFKVHKDGSDYQLLHSFDFDSGDGINPYEGLIEGSDGVLYGATRYGGSSMDAGTIFKLNKDGSGYNVLHRFSDVAGTGKWPVAGVIEASDGRLYGRTLNGGLADGGTVFRIDRNGSNFTVLRDSPLPEGNRFYAYTGLIEGSDGTLYGSSSFGGDHDAGTVFKLNKDGSDYTVLHHFDTIATDGSYPEGSVIEAGDGRLYGTTSFGGQTDSGVLFRINKDGSGYTILREFNTANKGANYPVGDLHEGPGGTLFGVTYFGGADDSGTIYMINRDGSGFTVLHSFVDAARAGQNPDATLIRGPDGGLYGTAVFGGLHGCGSIFRIAPITLAVMTEASGNRLHIGGTAGQRYAIERSGVLPATWVQIGTADNVAGTADYLDASAGVGPSFYRCRLLLP